MGVNVLMRGSGVDASDCKAEGGGCKDQFIRVVKWSCHLTVTEALSDSSVPSVNINGVDVVTCFCFSWRNYVMKFSNAYDTPNYQF